MRNLLLSLWMTVAAAQCAWVGQHIWDEANFTSVPTKPADKVAVKQCQGTETGAYCQNERVVILTCPKGYKVLYDWQLHHAFTADGYIIWQQVGYEWPKCLDEAGANAVIRDYVERNGPKQCPTGFLKRDGYCWSTVSPSVYLQPQSTQPTKKESHCTMPNQQNNAPTPNPSDPQSTPKPQTPNLDELAAKNPVKDPVKDPTAAAGSGSGFTLSQQSVTKNYPPQPGPLIPGRIVHYVMEDGSVRPMIVIGVDEGEGEPPTISGRVFLALASRDRSLLPPGAVYAESTAYVAGVPRDDNPKSAPGTWHWPTNR